MIYTYDCQEITAALRSSFIGDSQTLRQTADYFTSAALSPGFSLRLMEIVDDAVPPVQVKQAALVQLKNHFKRRWGCSEKPIDAAEKEIVRSALVMALCRCHPDYKLVKLYREVMAQVVSCDYRTWKPVQTVLELLKQQANPVPLVYALLAIGSNFEFSITPDERSHFFQFLMVSLPVLLELVSQQPLPELLYLCMKFLMKAVHYEISPQVRQLTCQWMPLLQAVLSASNPAYDATPQDAQPRSTDEFFYFHSKKWATRVLMRFVQKHAKRLSFDNTDNRPFSDHWFTTYGEGLTTTLLAQLATPAPTKIRYFQLKCLHYIIQERPNSVAQFADHFQYNYLLQFLQLKPEDEELANRDPLDFLSKEDDVSLNFTNLKRVATDVWVGFAELGSVPEKKKQSYEAGQFFFSNMNWLQGRLEGGNPLEKEMAMYLICQLRSPITRCQQVKKMLPTLIARYVVSEFQNPIMFLRARAVDIFTQYGSMSLDIQVVQQAVEGIYRCLTQDSCALVRIKAASAFNCILSRHDAAKDLVRPLVRDILAVYLQLLEHYDLENLVTSLESIVQDFAEEVAPFAFDLVRHLSKLFLKLFSKDAEQANDEDYDGQAELAAAGCIKTIIRIIQSPIPVEAITELEPDIIALLEFIFCESRGDYIEDVLVLLNSYLFKAPQLTAGLWFYCQAVIYNLVGIPEETWTNLTSQPLTDGQRKVFKSIKKGSNEQCMQTSLPVLRGYIQKVASCPVETSQPLKQNLLELLFYLNTTLYKKPQDSFSGEMTTTCCTALLINLLENFSSNLPEQIYSHVWDIAKFNFNSKTRILKVLTSQLIGLFIWANPTLALSLAHRDQLLQQLLKELIGYQSKYEMEHERARVVLGINRLLELPQKPSQLLTYLPEIFKTAVKLVRKNAEDRILKDPNHSVSSQDEFDQEEAMQNSDSAIQEDFWQEQYGENYTSPLDSIDQLALFNQTVQSLATQQPHLYAQLLTCVPQNELQSLQTKIKKAMDHVSKLVEQ